MKYENSNSHLNWPVMSGHTSVVKLPSKSAFCLATLAGSEEQTNFNLPEENA